MATVVVTGVDRGLGLELARLYGAQGDTVYAGCLNPAAPELIGLSKKFENIRVVPLDVTSESSVAAFSDRLHGKPLDLLVNNAGVHFRKWSVPENVVFSDWEITLRVNTLGPARMFFSLRESLLLAKKSKLVTISSDWGSVSVHPGTAYDYCSSKAAVNSVMRGIARNWGDKGITVLLLHPGWMRTSMGGSEAPNLPSESAMLVKSTIDRATASDNGRYIDTAGNDMPW